MDIGIKGKLRERVTAEKTAKVVGSGTLAVYATPAMAALMEKTAAMSVQQVLEDGTTTVGTALNIEHVSATPEGLSVTCESELVKIDGRKLVFSLLVYDEKGVVGKGEHTRFIVDSEKFFLKAKEKLK